MTLPPDTIVINGAPSQYDRWMRALDPGYIEPDGRSFQELLDFAVRYARLIRFYDLNDRPKGDWAEFFLTDPTMILASVEALTPYSIETAYSALETEIEDEPRFEPKFEGLRKLFETILQMARSMDRWLLACGVNPGGTAARLLAADISDLIVSRLREQLQQLASYAEGAAQSEALGRSLKLNFGSFGPMWKLGKTCPNVTPYRGRSASRKIDNALPYLAPIFWNFLDALGQLQRFARLHFEQTLEESDHKPQIGLYMAFARLFRTAQDTLNTINRRYIDFYYRKVLRETNAGPVPAQVYVTFTLDSKSGISLAVVPKGAQFPAGQDNQGAAILYAADKELGVTGATIAAVRTLRRISGPLTSEYSSPAAWDGVTGAAAQHAVTQQVLISDIDLTAPGVWPAFGPDSASQTAAELTATATMGFAIATQYLLLAGGTRTVTVAMRLTQQSQDNLNRLLLEIAEATALDPVEIFETILDSAFKLYLSTAGGWFPVQQYQAESSPASPADFSGFSLAFELPATVPPITGYNPAPDQKLDLTVVSGDPEVNATNPAPSMPTLKAYLQQEPVYLDGEDGTVEVYPLSLLECAEIEAIEVAVKVETLPATVENNFGPVDTSSTFNVFGGGVTAGSYVEVSNPEIFVKVPAPHSLRIGVQWFNLPINDTGFTGYYRDYVIGPDGKVTPDLFDNQVFRVAPEVVNPGLWTVRNTWPPKMSDPPPDPSLYLFRTSRDGCANPVPDKSGKLCAATVFETLEAEPTSALPPYYDPSVSALRFTLNQPSYAFGDDLYAKNVLNAVIADLPIQVGVETCACVPACQPLWDTSQRLGACLGGCKDASPDEYYNCIAPCLESCEERLVLAFQGCFLQCLSQCPDLPGSTTLESIQGVLDSYAGQPPAMQAQDLLIALGGPNSFLTGCSLACFNNVSQLLQAALWIEDCLTSCSPPEDEQCIQAKVVACQLKLQNAYTACMATQKQLQYPNTPWVPTASAVEIDYRAECKFSPTRIGGQCGSFYYLLPMGGSRPGIGSAAGQPLLPPLDYAGSLYLGFTGLDSPQTLSLLFQMQATGIENLPPVTWQYLSGGAWTSFTPRQLRSDTTNGLQNTGVVTLSVPSLDSLGGTGLAAGDQWLRATVQKDPGSFPGIAGIYPHSITATWQNTGGTGENLSQPLPPYTIKSSVNPIPGIATIVQPLESFGGVPPENDKQFIVRLGERLRHKDRAILSWDYERLVLDRFPTIWKVQVLPTRDREGGNVPGSVLVAVVTGPDSIEVADPTTPTATTEMLGEIRGYLQGLVSPFAALDVVNPNYVRIEVIATVLFSEEDDAGASADRLSQELIQYLSPWFYNVRRAALGGEYASQDAISEFIQSRAYVEGLQQIEYVYTPDPEELEWCFLTSATKHDIQPG